MKKFLTILALGAFMSAVDVYAEESVTGVPRHEQLRNEQHKLPKPEKSAQPKRDDKNRNTFAERVRMHADKLHEMYDLNKDGVIDEAEHKKMDDDFEIAKRLQPYIRTKSIIDAVDKDRDLRISDSEAKAIRQAGRQQMRDRKAPPTPPATKPAAPPAHAAPTP